MTAKTYTQLVDQANATLADNIARNISAADVRAMHVDHLDSQNIGTILVRMEQGTPLPAAGAAGRLFFETIVSALHVDDGSTFRPVVMTFAGRPGPAIVPAANDYSINQLSNVTLTASATDDILVFNGAIFVNQARQWLENVGNNWVPKISGTGIGSVDASPSFVALGDVAVGSSEGFIASNDDADGGGLLLVGFRGDPAGASDPNAPVVLAGNAIILDGATLYMAVPAAVTVDHFLISKPSVVFSDGTIAVPIVLGPEFVPTTEESDTSAANVSITPAATEIDILGGTEGAGLVLATAFASGSTINISMTIEETGGGSAIVTVTMKIDGTPSFTDIVNLQNNRFNYFVSQPTTALLNIGQVLSLHVDYINGQGGGTRTVNVRGDVTVSSLSIQSS